MKIGTLVKLDEWFGIVVGRLTHHVTEEEHILVKWLTGSYTGDTDAVMENRLEVLCK